MITERMLALLVVAEMLFDPVIEVWEEQRQERRVKCLLRSLDECCRKAHGVPFDRYARDAMMAPPDVVRHINELLNVESKYLNEM